MYEVIMIICGTFRDPRYMVQTLFSIVQLP